MAEQRVTEAGIRTDQPRTLMSGNGEHVPAAAPSDNLAIPGQRVTDEQLTDWMRDADRGGMTVCSWWPTAILALIADLRASRAREAELIEAFQAATSSGVEWERVARKNATQRDGLQQRIGRALTLCAQMCATVDIDQDEYERLRAALAGTDVDRG